LEFKDLLLKHSLFEKVAANIEVEEGKNRDEAIETTFTNMLDLALSFAQSKALGRSWKSFDEELTRWKTRRPPYFPETGKQLKRMLQELFALLGIEPVKIVYCSKGPIPPIVSCRYVLLLYFFN